MADDEMKEPLQGAPLADPQHEGPRGEDLASAHLRDDVPAVEVAPDESEAEELTDTTPVREDEMVEDAAQLEEAEQVAVAASSTRPKKRSQPAVEDPAQGSAAVEPGSLRPKRVPAKKDAPTPTRASAQGGKVKVRDKRVGPGQFIRECVEELRKVVWPTGEQLSNYFVVVLLFVLFIIAYVSLLDGGFGWLLLKIFG